ncbi:MAG TPA: hypothetical protein DDY13_15960 [Cytophagales bacterium]|jgi:hypothetical protein|nr:hypothetical protein [Cytophagales bacterium]
MNILSQNNIENIGLRWGLIVFALLGLYFMLMKMLGLIHVIELRLLNGVIMFYGCFSAVKTARKNLADFNFFKGMGTGMLTALISSGLFTVFGFIFLTFIEPSFMTEIKNNEALGIYQNKFIATAQIFVEGTASGFFFSQAATLWFKKARPIVTDK